MSFAHPLVLFLLVIPACLLIWVWRREGRRVVLPIDHSRSGPGNWLRRMVNVAESLPPVVLAIVILILAGPRQWGAPQDKRVMTNIEFCVDVSGSMTAPFGSGTRYDASMEAINEFLDFRIGDAFGLTFFGNSVLHWVPLTTDVSAIRCAPPFMKPGQIPPWFGGTAIGKALLACRRVLTAREEGDRMIILVSDGESADLFGGTDVEIARSLKAANIVVFSIHVGDSRVPDAIVNITHLTGGEVFEAGDRQGLTAIFHRIDLMVPTRLEKIRGESIDYYLPFCLAGLAVLSLGGLSLLGARYTPW